MFRVFTYHKVLRDAGKAADEFYTISEEQLAQHLEIFASRGWQAVRMEDLGTAALENAFALTFDDGTSDHYEVVFPLLEKNRCRASYYIPTAKLNQPGFLTSAQVREIAAAGHEIGSHSHEHQRMDRLTEEELRQQIGRSQEIIAGIVGKKPVTFVPPGGFTNERIRKAAAELGMRTLRTMRWGYNQNFNPMALETIPINHYTDDKKFEKLLKPHRAGLIYAGKEALKRVLPLSNYERLRSLVFKFRKSD